MGFDVTFTDPGVGQELALATARRRGLQAGARLVLAKSDTLAPREAEPRHGVHMTETGFVRVEPGIDDTVAIGYEAYWAVWQNENLLYHHPEGGQAKFLDTALLTGAEMALEQVAIAMREAGA